jgi:hypothetical protein
LISVPHSPPLRAPPRYDTSFCPTALAAFDKGFQERGYSSNYDWDNALPGAALLLLKMGVGDGSQQQRFKTVRGGPG